MEILIILLRLGQLSLFVRVAQCFFHLQRSKGSAVCLWKTFRSSSPFPVVELENKGNREFKTRVYGKRQKAEVTA